MRTHRFIHGLLFLFMLTSALVAWSGPPVTLPHTQELVLMVLEHTENGKPVQTKVVAKAGKTVSPLRGKAIEKIRVFPGNPLVLEQRPSDVVVELYRDNGVEAGILCAIGIRYFRDARGLWVPHFQLIEEVQVVRGPNGSWRPLNLARGAPSLVVLSGNALPNVEGFYPTFELGLSAGMLQIDHWTMR